MTQTATTARAAETARYDRMMLMVLIAHLPVVGGLVPIGYGTHLFAAVASALTTGLAVFGYRMLRGTPAFAVLAAALLMTYSAIMIQAQYGRIEMHFHIFGAIPFLLIYRRWLPIVVAAGFIATHHLAATGLQLAGVEIAGIPVTVYDYGCSWGIAFLHAAFVIAETGVLVQFSLMMARERDTADALIAAVGDTVNAQDLTVRVPGTGHVEEAFNRMASELGSLVREFAAAADEVNTTSARAADAVRKSRDDLGEQHAQTEQAASAIEEMSATINDVAGNTQAAARASSEADQRTQEGARLVVNAKASMQSLSSGMVDASDAIATLAESTARIGSVVHVIHDISEQTNLLALNAAIEAARAGEQGRGFAVVADEVRSLAVRTKESTAEIQSIIEGLQHDTNSAVGNIGTSRELTETVAAEIDAAGSLLEEIAASVSDINRMNLEVATATEQQGAVATSVASNIGAIADLSERVVTEADSNAATIAALSELAGRLRGLAERYRA